VTRVLASRILSSEQLDLMKEKLEIILAERGVKVGHAKVLRFLGEAGADVSASRARFPRSLIDEVLKKAPRQYTLAGIDPRYDLAVPHPGGLFYTRTSTGALNYYAEDGAYYPVAFKEVQEFTKLSSYLENIDFCSLPSPRSKYMPQETLDIHTLRTVLQNTTKHIWVQPYEQENSKYLLEIAALVVGGKEKLKERPIISLIACSNSPLEYKAMDMEIVLQCCKYGVPIHACSLPTGGANAPVTAEGLALVAAVEVMALVLIAQLIQPGTAVVATPLPFSLDMLSTQTLQSPIEVTMSRMAAVQLFTEGYGLPAHTYGTGADSILLDAQNMIERTSLAHLVALSGASVLGGGGQLEVAKTISPLQLIIDNDIFGIVKQLKSGLEIDDENLAFNEIKGLTGREEFISMDHTFNHFRNVYRPRTFFRGSRLSWEEQGSKDLIARTRDIYASIRDDYQDMRLPEDISTEIDKTIKCADQEIAGTAKRPGVD